MKCFDFNSTYIYNSELAPAFWFPTLFCVFSVYPHQIGLQQEQCVMTLLKCPLHLTVTSYKKSIIHNIVLYFHKYIYELAIQLHNDLILQPWFLTKLPVYFHMWISTKIRWHMYQPNVPTYLDQDRHQGVAQHDEHNRHTPAQRNTYKLRRMKTM